MQKSHGMGVIKKNKCERKKKRMRSELPEPSAKNLSSRETEIVSRNRIIEKSGKGGRRNRPGAIRGDLVNCTSSGNEEGGGRH